MAPLDNAADRLGPGTPRLCFMGTRGAAQFQDLSQQHVTGLLPISSFLQGLMQGRLSPVLLPLTGQGPENRRGRSVASLPL